VPPAFDRPILVVVVALLEMALCVAFTAGHGTNRQHSATLALFETPDQQLRAILHSMQLKTLYLRKRTGGLL